MKMKTEPLLFHHVPALLYGPPADRVFLFLHGQCGRKEEAAAFARLAVPAGFQVLGVDLPGHGERPGVPADLTPEAAVPELQEVYAWLAGRWGGVSLRANSIGAYLGMQALGGRPLANALFVSPLVGMEALILARMAAAGVTEEALRAQGAAEAGPGEPPLSWAYLCWVRAHPLPAWNTPAQLLCGGRDELLPRPAAEAFAAAIHAGLTVYEPGGHWFHTPAQRRALAEWEAAHLLPPSA